MIAPNSVRLLALSAPCLLWAACGYPDFQFDAEAVVTTASSSSVASASSSSSGSGGSDASASSSSSSSASSSSSSGSGGAKPCTFGETEACGVGEKCGIADAAKKTIACIAAGEKLAWQSCSVDKDCTAGTVCDLFYSVCKPICASAATCEFKAKKGVVSFTTQGDCVPLRTSGGSEFDPTKVKHCTAQCEPSKASPCDSTKQTTCAETNVGGGAFDCAKSGGKAKGNACDQDSDCAAGMLCIGNGSVQGEGECTPWCDDPGAAPSSACPIDRPVCYPLVPKVTYTLNGKVVDYGACGT